MLVKVVKPNAAHELFMNMYVVVVSQCHYCIDDKHTLPYIKCVHSLNEMVVEDRLMYVWDCPAMEDLYPSVV